MRKVIYKYPVALTVGFEESVEMPIGAEIVRFKDQGGRLVVWAIVSVADKYEENVGTEMRRFRVVGTGHKIPEGVSYIASCDQGPFVWHLFEERANG